MGWLKAEICGWHSHTMPASTSRFTAEQRCALKKQMRKHPTRAKFTSNERGRLCITTNLSREQVRMWERNYCRMDDAQRLAFLDKEETKALLPKGHARRVYGTAFNTNHAFFECFLQFDGVPDTSNLRSIVYIEAAMRIEMSSSVFMLCFASKVLLSTVHNYLTKLGAGSIMLDSLGNANNSLSGAGRALYNIQNTTRVSDSPEEGRFVYGTVPAAIDKSAQRLKLKKHKEPNA